MAMLVTLPLVGCGGGDGASEERPTVDLVYVSWVEGIAMTHVLKVVLEDSLGVDAPLTQAGGAAFAFSAVASGDADAFVDAWLPVTHGPLWDEYGDRLTDIGPVYDSTTVGLVVPDYAPIDHVRELPQIRDALDGEVIGIESGAAINDQTRQILEAQGLADRFSVVSSSGAAMTSALSRAINNREPIVVTGWRPHWKWGRFDLRYLRGAQTGQTDVFGAPENIHKLVRPGFRNEAPERVVQFLENVHLERAPMEDLVAAFQPGEGGQEAPLETARRWIREHPDVVRAWLSDASPAASASRASASGGR